MSRIEALNDRYSAVVELLEAGATVVSVADPLGARLDAAVRQLQRGAEEDGSGIWDDLVGSAKALRWRCLSQPQPIAFNFAVPDGAREVIQLASSLRVGASDPSVIDDLVDVATEISSTDPPVGEVLLGMLDLAGRKDVCVVAASRAAQVSIESWLRNETDVCVRTVGDVNRRTLTASSVVAIGPARFLDASLVTAPIAGDLCFLIPDWFSDKRMPSTPFAQYAEGAIRIETRVIELGKAPEIQLPLPIAEAPPIEDDYLPQPIWAEPESGRVPARDEALARKVLLAGGLAIWLDDGDRIRAFDPSQPDGERVIYVGVNEVRRGTYLLLRHGSTERGAIHEAAIARLGDRGDAVERTQVEWKARLAQRLEAEGTAAVVRQLRNVGVGAADRAAAWTDPNLVRPISDLHFERLIDWLGLPLQPTFGHATLLRKTIHAVSSEIREQLERAASQADVSVLEERGHLSLEAEAEGFRPIIATRVLAISPGSYVIARRDARLLMPEGGHTWLE